MAADETAPAVMVCFQLITRGGAVIDTEPESWPSITAASTRAAEWMALPPEKTITFTTFEGDGAVVRPSEIEHIAVMKAEKMANLYEEMARVAEEST